MMDKYKCWMNWLLKEDAKDVMAYSPGSAARIYAKDAWKFCHFDQAYVFVEKDNRLWEIVVGVEQQQPTFHVDWIINEKEASAPDIDVGSKSEACKPS